MDWLRSEDLKEENVVTAPAGIIAVHALCRCQDVARRTIAHAPNGIQNVSILTLTFFCRS
jgi:hypothetical protein